MTASELHDRLLDTLVREQGSTRRRWRLVTGPVRVLDPMLHPHCNWSVEASGGAREVEAVEALLDRLRLSHPMVTEG